MAIYSLINHKKRGFSLIELLFVIVIISLALATLSKLKPVKRVSLPIVLEEINAIFARAYNEALIQKVMYQVRFFFDDEQHIRSIGYGPVENFDVAGKSTIQDAKKNILKEKVIAKKFIIAGKDELASSRTKELWFIIYPEGYAQECRIRLFLDDHGGLTGNYILNPFSVRLEEDEAE